MTAYVEDSGTTIRLQYQMNIYSFRWHKAPDPILGWLSAHTLCDGETVSATNAQQIELTGGPKKPLLGIEVRTITPEVAATYTAGWWTPVIKEGFRACNRARKTNTAGAIVASVVPNSPAAAAGLKTGDIINVQKGGGLFCSAEELVKYVGNIVPDYPYTLEVYFGSNKPWLYTLKNAAVNAY